MFLFSGGEMARHSEHTRSLIASGMAAAALHLFLGVIGFAIVMRWTAESPMVHEVFLAGKGSGELAETPAPAKERKIYPTSRQSGMRKEQHLPETEVQDTMAEAPTAHLAQHRKVFSEERTTISGSQAVVSARERRIAETIFGEGTGPRFLRQEQPVYPLMARKMGKQGWVILRLSIDEKGILTNVEVLEDSGFGFADAAVSAVRKSTFLAATHEGRPIPSRARLPIIFRLSN